MTRENDGHGARQVLRVRGWWRGVWFGGCRGGWDERPTVRSIPSWTCECDSRPALLRPLPAGVAGRRVACLGTRWISRLCFCQVPAIAKRTSICAKRVSFLSPDNLCASNGVFFCAVGVFLLSIGSPAILALFGWCRAVLGRNVPLVALTTSVGFERVSMFRLCEVSTIAGVDLGIKFCERFARCVSQTSHTYSVHGTGSYEIRLG